MRADRAVLLGTGWAAALFWTSSVLALFTLPKAAAISAGLALAGLLALARPGPFPVALAWPVGAGLAVSLLSARLSIDPLTSWVGRYDTWSHGVVSLLAYGLLMLLSASAFAGSRSTAPWALAALGAVLDLHSLIQRAGLDPNIMKAALPQGRAVASLGSPIDLGGALALMAPSAVWALGRSLPAGAALCALAAAGLWATGARGAWLGAASGVVVFLTLERPRWLEKTPRALRWAAAAACAGAVIGSLALTFRPGKDVARFEVWKAAARAYAERPVLGSGPDTFEMQFRRLRGEGFIRAMHKTTAQQAYAHNDLLQAMATTGTLGLLAYLWLLWTFVALTRAAMTDPSARSAAAAAAAGLAALFVDLKFNPVSLEVLTLASIVAGIACAAPGTPAPSRILGRALGAAALACGLGGLWGVRTLWKADLAEKQARALAAAGSPGAAAVKHLQALTLTPCELSFVTSAINDLGPALNADKTEEGRLKLLQLSLQLTDRGVACHPRDVNAYYAAGFAHFYHAELGLKKHLAEAETAIDKALELDPLFDPLVVYRMNLARARGDAKKLAELQARLAHLNRLSEGR